MRVFKFGGASVKNAEGVKQVAGIINKIQNGALLVIVSAMDKTTNALEKLTYQFYHRDPVHRQVLQEIKDFHYQVASALLERDSPRHAGLFDELNNVFVELEWILEDEPHEDFDFVYDQIVYTGEILSTKIVNAYLQQQGINSTWVDARNMIQTDNTYREGKVNWELTRTLVDEQLRPILQKHPLPAYPGGEPAGADVPPLRDGAPLTRSAGGATPHNGGRVVVTQGFIGGTSENYTTTLGRDGSDYSAAIFAHCLHTENVTIWKDVPGVLNADPKWFDNTEKIPQLTYNDAIELAYYGANVIHPKTIKPLENKNIPLHVKSFLDPDAPGTLVCNDQNGHLPVPCFIFKMNQRLISVHSRDFSFINENAFSNIFRYFSEAGVKINVMQNTAISFSVSVDDTKKVPPLIKRLRAEYKVLFNSGMELVTIRYYNQETIDRVLINKKLYLEQKSRYTVQLVVKDLDVR